MSVYYRFKSNVNCDKVTFDGLHISVGELKKQILQQKKIGKSNDFDLQISNAETKEVYSSDDMLIQKNTTVIVARVPVNTNRKQWKDAEQTLSVNHNEPHVSLDKIIKSSELSNLDETEEEKLKTIMTQSTQDYDSSKFIKTRPMVGPVPPNYICYRCGKGGHYIKHCPTNQTDNVKRSTGIPRSFMMPAKADQRGALITSTGEYVVPIIDHQAYKEPKKEKPPFIPTENPEFDEKLVEKIPDELQCLLCKNLLHDAVMIPCCSNSYCDDCIRTCLLESEQHQCPTCLSTGISPDTLLPNRYLRNKAHKYKNEYFKPLNKTNNQNAVNYSNDCSTNSKLNSDSKSPVQSPNLNLETKDEKKEENILKTDKEILNEDKKLGENNKNDETVESNSISSQIIEPQLSPKSTIEEDKKLIESETISKDSDMKSDVNEDKPNEEKFEDSSNLNDEESNEELNNQISNEINSANNEKPTESPKPTEHSTTPELNPNKDETKLKDNKETNNNQQLNEESNKSHGSNGQPKKNSIGNDRNIRQPHQQNQRLSNQQQQQQQQQQQRHSILGNPPASNQQRMYSNNNNFNNSPQHQMMYANSNSNYAANNYQLQQRNSHRGQQGMHQSNKQNNQLQQQFNNHNIHHAGGYNNQMQNQPHNLRQYPGQMSHAGSGYYGDSMYGSNYNGFNQIYNAANNYSPVDSQQYPNNSMIASNYNYPNSYMDQNADPMYPHSKYLDDSELTAEEKLERFGKELEKLNKKNQASTNHISPNYLQDPLRKRSSRSKSRPRIHRSRSQNRSASYSRSRSRSSYSSSSSSSRSTSKSYSRSRSRSIHHQNNRRYNSSKGYHYSSKRSPKYTSSKHKNYHDSSSNYHHLNSSSKTRLSKSRSKSLLSYNHVNYAKVNYDRISLDHRPHNDKHGESLEKEYKDNKDHHYKSSKRSSDYYHSKKSSGKNSSLDKHSPNYEYSSTKRHHSSRKEEDGSRHSSDRHKRKHSSSRKHRSDKKPKAEENDKRFKEKQLETIDENQEIKDKNKLNLTKNPSNLEEESNSPLTNSSHNSKNDSPDHNLVCKSDDKIKIENNLEINKDQQKSNRSSKSSDKKSVTPEPQQKLPAESLFNLMTFHAEKDSFENDELINKEPSIDIKLTSKETDDENRREEDEESESSESEDEGLIEDEDDNLAQSNQTKSIVVSPIKLTNDKESEKHRPKSESIKNRKDKDKDNSSKKKHKSKDKKRDRENKEKLPKSSKDKKRKLETDEADYLSSKKHKKKHKKEKKSKKHKLSKDSEKVKKK